MALELLLKINNQIVSDYSSPIRIFDANPTLSWSFNLTNKVSVDSSTGIATIVTSHSQYSYDIRISTINWNIGTDAFIGNYLQTGNVESQEFFWRYLGKSIERGDIY